MFGKKCCNGFVCCIVSVILLYWFVYFRDSIVEFVSSKDGLSELSLPPANGFIRKLIYQEVWKKYTPDDLRIESRNGVMVVKRSATEKELADDEKKKQDQEEAEINEAVGFSNVIRLISQSVSSSVL